MKKKKTKKNIISCLCSVSLDNVVNYSFYNQNNVLCKIYVKIDSLRSKRYDGNFPRNMSAVVQLTRFIIMVLEIFWRSFNQLNERPIIVFHLNMVLNNGPKVHKSADHGSDRGQQNPNPKVKILPPQFPIFVFQNKPIHYANFLRVVKNSVLSKLNLSRSRPGVHNPFCCLRLEATGARVMLGGADKIATSTKMSA